jgi:hypothetical protein
MKALSIRHPWVDLILAGTKAIEIRTWSTRHRGPLLLHASSAYGISEREAAARLRLPPPAPSTLGAVVGVAELVDCRPVRPDDWKGAGLPPLDAGSGPGSWLSRGLSGPCPVPAGGPSSTSTRRCRRPIKVGACQGATT